jgi:AraC-like DNA-binding protein
MANNMRDPAPILPSETDASALLRIRWPRDVTRLFRPAISSEGLGCRGIFAWVLDKQGSGRTPTVAFSGMTIALLHAGTVQGEFDSGAVSHPFRPSGLAVLPPGMPVALTYADVVCTIIHLRPELLAPPELGDLNRLQLMPQLDPSDLVLALLVTAIHDELHRTPQGRRMFFQTVGSAIVAHVMDRYAVPRTLNPGTRGGLTPRQLRIVKEAMTVARDDNFSLADIAQAAGLSYWNLCHGFKQSMGEAPYQWYQRQRIARAQQLLAENKLSVTQIAAELNYASPSHFSTKFKDAMGISPSLYRRKVLE